MHKEKHIGAVLRRKDAKETKDKIEIVEGKKYFLYFLYTGKTEDVNSNRGISAFSKYVKNNFPYFQDGEIYKLQDLVLGGNKRVLELGLEALAFGLVVFYVPKKEESKTWFAQIGKSAVNTVDHSQFTRVNTKQSEKLLGDKNLSKADIAFLDIRKTKSSIFACNSEFLPLLADKRKDIKKILNYKILSNSKVAMERIMKNKNFSDLSYLFIKR
ncbi:hypothetical protein C0584_01295 [Candidatus Parcubacteria bacterium]|nr:MAG: hypothetical protein C0584_01295 [Candidatus Parcubacteria bacterium]